MTWATPLLQISEVCNQGVGWAAFHLYLMEIQIKNKKLEYLYSLQTQLTLKLKAFLEIGLNL
jgi:hypothetical protein